MTENSRTVAVIKGQISKSSSRKSSMAYRRPKLSHVTRTLNESIPLIKTENRLSRNLDDRDFTKEINSQICRLKKREDIR